MTTLSAQLWDLGLERAYKPRLQVCSGSRRRYGHSFSRPLWPHLQTLLARLTPTWKEENRGADWGLTSSLPVYELAHVTALAPDYLSRWEGKPLEQVLGNYGGRESERRTDPSDRNAR